MVVILVIYKRGTIIGGMISVLIKTVGVVVIEGALKSTAGMFEFYP